MSSHVYDLLAAIPLAPLAPDFLTFASRHRGLLRLLDKDQRRELWQAYQRRAADQSDDHERQMLLEAHQRLASTPVAAAAIESPPPSPYIDSSGVVLRRDLLVSTEALRALGEGRSGRTIAEARRQQAQREMSQRIADRYGTHLTVGELAAAVRELEVGGDSFVQLYRRLSDPAAVVRQHYHDQERVRRLEASLERARTDNAALGARNQQLERQLARQRTVIDDFMDMSSHGDSPTMRARMSRLRL